MTPQEILDVSAYTGLHIREVRALAEEDRITPDIIRVAHANAKARRRKDRAMSWLPLIAAILGCAVILGTFFCVPPGR